jgi:hypothetical protein
MNMEWVAGFEVHRAVCVKGCNAVYIVNTRCTRGRHRLQMQNPRVLCAALFTSCFLLVSLFTYPSTLKMEAVPSSRTQDLLRNAPRYNSWNSSWKGLLSKQTEQSCLIPEGVCTCNH